MNRRTFLALGASTALVSVAGCGGSGESPEATTEGAAESDAGAEVRMVDNSFDPRRLSVEPGTTVTWTNAGSAAHTVGGQTFHDVAETWEINADTLDPGDSTSFTFEEAGVYEYLCTIHGQENMCGVVLVGDVSLDQSLPCEGSVDSGGDGNESDG